MSERTIWKYELEITDRQTITMPHGAEILCVQTQHGRPCLWALVEPAVRPGARTIAIFGTTGNPVELGPHARYIGTFQLDAGRFVGHVWEEHARA